MEILKTNKDRKKFRRSIVEAIILIGLLIAIIEALLVFSKYVPYDENDQIIMTGENNGFIAISYIAVDREGTATMISTERLKEQLGTLYKNGYVTITQQDIMDYYKNGKTLPEKSLFLLFEDGRRDTTIFAQKIMEEYNYIGTILSYADKFDNKDTKFLIAKDLINLKKSTFWELGTNGHRLSYINVFDTYNRYLGELNSVEYSELNKYLGRNYNQYLMDFIRDENQIPKETYAQMTERISNEYELMDKIYTKELGEIPNLYVLMHSNTGSYANNEKVSGINEEWMKKLFVMNFNREGFSLNNTESDLYDLTRMQPQPYWYPNHLLMRISDDTQKDMVFEQGDTERKERWDILKGAAEFRDSVIALTSESEGNGLIQLKESKNFQDYKLSTHLTGNKLGTQTIYLRADENLEQYVSVKIQNNYLYVEENGNKLFELNLDEHDNIINQSVEEREQEALAAEYETYSKNTDLFGDITNMEQQAEYITKEVRSVEDGAEEYLPLIQINEAGNRQVEIDLQDNKISISIDEKVAALDLPLSGQSSGYVYLESAWGEYGYSQRNIADDVYDGVFEDLVISEVYDSTVILYDNQLSGWDKIKAKVEMSWNRVLNWFINTL